VQYAIISYHVATEAQRLSTKPIYQTLARRYTLPVRRTSAYKAVFEVHGAFVTEYALTRVPRHPELLVRAVKVVAERADQS